MEHTDREPVTQARIVHQTNQYPSAWKHLWPTFAPLLHGFGANG